MSGVGSKLVGLIRKGRDGTIKLWESWMYGMQYGHTIPNDPGVVDTGAAHVFSYHFIGGGETARKRLEGGWEIDYDLDPDLERDPEFYIENHEYKRFDKWQYMTAREKKSIDPSMFREWFHRSRPPVIMNGLPPQCHKPNWQQQQLVLYHRWLIQGIPPKPGNAYHMHNIPFKDHAEDWWWPIANYDEMMVAMDKYRYMKSKAGQKDRRRYYEQSMRQRAKDSPQV